MKLSIESLKLLTPHPRTYYSGGRSRSFLGQVARLTRLCNFGISNRYILINMLLSGGSTTKAASKTIPVQEERAKVLPKIRYEPDNKQHENDQKQSIFDFR